MLDEAAAKEVNLALDLTVNARDGAATRGQALQLLARFYLTRCRPAVGEVTTGTS